MDIEAPHIQQQAQEQQQVPVLSAPIQFRLEGKQKNITNQANFNIYDTYSQIVIGEDMFINLIHSNVLSVGKGGQILNIFIDSDRYNESEDDCEEEDPNDQILGLILTQNHGNFNLTGELQMQVQFQSNETLQAFFSKLIELIEEDDEGNSEYEGNQEFGEMIGADDIDQDGNIIQKESSEEEPKEMEEQN